MGLTVEQKKLVEAHMNLVPYAIKKYIKLTGDIDMEYEDLTQQGNLALCKAAQKYNKSVKFNTFAEIVIRSELLRYCKKVSKKAKTESIEDLGIEEKVPADTKDFDELIMSKENIQRIEKIKEKYSGIILKGMNALELKIQGFAGIDIAKMYGVKSNHVSAWISKAKKELLADEKFIAQISCK